MLRIKFKKPCHVEGKTHSAGDEIDIDDALGERIAAMGVAEVLGPSDHYAAPAVDITSGAQQPSLLGKFKNLLKR